MDEEIDVDETKENVQLGEYIDFKDLTNSAAERTIITKTSKQVKENKDVSTYIQEAFLFTPDQIKNLGVNEINIYLLMIPKGLIYYQDIINVAQNNLAVAEYKFDDIIVTPSYSLSKDDFGKGTNNITEKMRMAKMKSLYPKEFKELVSEIRKWKSIVIKLDGHIKHIQTLNDNLKKIRESAIAHLRSE